MTNTETQDFFNLKTTGITAVTTASTDAEITTYVNAIFQAVLGRDPAAQGLANISAAIKAGTFDGAEFANVALTANVNDAKFDYLTADEKTAAATSQTTANAAFTAEFTAKADSLTTGTDTLTGSLTSDTFTAPILTVTGEDSIIDSSTTDSDTFNATLNTNVTNNVTLTNIENINLTALGARTVDMANMTGVEAITTVDSTGSLTLNNVGSASASVAFSGTSTNSIIANYAAGVLSGSADSLALGLSTATSVSVDADAGFESVTITAAGVSDINTLTVPGIATVLLSGTGSVDFADTTLDGIATISASSYAGDITTGTVQATGFVDADIVGSTTGSTVLLGSGNDNIGFTNASTTAANSNTVQLGAGDDKLVLNAAAAGDTFIFGQAGDDSVRIDTTVLGTSDMIDLGAGTNDTVTANISANNLVLKGVENLTLAAKVGAANTQTITSSDQALVVTALTDNTAVTINTLTAGSTVAVNTNTDAATSTASSVAVNFAANEATSTININSGMTSTLTLAKIVDATVNLGAASTATAAAVTTTDATNLTINATGDYTTTTGNITTTDNKMLNLTVAGTGAVTYDDADSTKLQTVTATAATNLNVGDVIASNDMSTVSYTATAGTLAYGAIGNNTALEIANVTISAQKAITAAAGSIDGLKIGTVSVTSVENASAIGFIGTTGNTQEIDTVTVTGGTTAAITNIFADAGAKTIGTVTVTGGTTAAIGTITTDTLTAVNMTAGTTATVGITTAATVTAMTVTGGTTATVGNIAVANAGDGIIGNIAITATNGLLTVGTDNTDQAISTDKTIGTIDLVSTANGISVNEDTTGGAAEIEAADATGMTLNMTAKTEISDEGADQTAFQVLNTAGDITATLAGAAIAYVDYEVSATKGMVNLTATNTGGLDSTIVLGGTLGEGETSTITLGNAKTATTNAVTIDGVTDTLNITGGTGVDVVDFAAGNDIKSGTIALGSTLATADLDKVDFTLLDGIVTDAHGIAVNLGSTLHTFSDTNNTTVAAGKAVEYDATDAANNVQSSGYSFTLSDIEHVVGTDSADYIIANAAGMTIDGGAGDDTLVGGAAADTIIAGAGADTITGAAGNDTITAGTNVDTIVFSANAAANGTDAIDTFSLAEDFINVDAMTSTTALAADIAVADAGTADTITAGEVYLVTSVVANQADTAADAAAAINAAGTWTESAADELAYFIVADDNSSVVYEYTYSDATAEVQEAELTLMGTVDAVLTATEIIFA